MLSLWKLPAMFLVLLHLNGGHELHEEDNPGPGHLEPLGSQGPTEGKIDTLDDFLDPLEFYDKYVLPGRPVLIKNGARQIPAFTLWNDAYLSEKYGDETVEVEVGKKENREGSRINLRLYTFLKMYNDTDIYLVADTLDSMKGDLSLPRSLQCGGFQNQLLQAVLWFSSGGTKSVLHNDQPDNINCILDGNKDIIFIDKKYVNEVEANGWQEMGGYSKIDVESVDLKAFPHFKSLPTWSATMLKGDCLFIPHRWYHTVKSSNTRNFAVNLWFSHLMWFNKTDCQQNPAKQRDISLENVTLLGLDSVEQIRMDLFADLEGRKEIYREDVLDTWDGLLNLEEIQQVFGLVDADHDMVLSWEEIYNLDILMIARNFPQLIGFPEDEFSDEAHDEL